MIRVATESNPAPERLDFVQAQAEMLPFGGGEFDLAMSTISFHHWSDQRAGLREIARVLAPGGGFVLADHFVTSWQRPFFAGRGRRDRFHTPAEIDAMLGEADLTRIAWREAYRIGPLLIVPAVLARKAG